MATTEILVYGTPQYAWRCNHVQVKQQTIAYGDTKSIGKTLVEVRLNGPRGGEKAALHFNKAQAEELANAILMFAQRLP